MNLLNIPGWIKWYKIRAEKEKGDACKLTQREANILCEGFCIDPANMISNFANMVMTCCFFSPIIPLAIPLAFISAIIDYWINKYNLLRKYKRPDMFGEFMATFFANAMPYLVLAWSISSFIFYLHLVQYFFTKQEIADIKKEFGKIPVDNEKISIISTALSLTIICILCPIRTCI